MEALLKGAAVWLGIAFLAVVNGFVREVVFKQRLGERYAHLLSTILLSALVMAASFVATPWIGIATIGGAWALGFGWLAATLAFEFLAGHYLFGNSWAKIFADYKAWNGRVWLLVPFCTLWGPPMAFRGMDSQWILPYTVSLIVAVGVLWLAFAKPTWARWSLAILFGYAGIYNTWIGLTRPEEYENFAKFVLIPWYREFILGPFAENSSLFIVLIAIGQLLSAVAVAIGGRFLLIGVFGVCAFLLAIAPFGVGSAFPFSILVSLAALVIIGDGPPFNQGSGLR